MWWVDQRDWKKIMKKTKRMESSMASMQWRGEGANALSSKLNSLFIGRSCFRLKQPYMSMLDIWQTLIFF